MAKRKRPEPTEDSNGPASLALLNDAAEPSRLLRKAVNTLAIVPKSTRITTLARKAYNVLLYQAQDQGLEKEVFRAPLDTVITGVDFHSNDHELIKRHLRAMVSTTVEWQSPTKGEGNLWQVSGLLAHAALVKRDGRVWVEWSYAVNLRQELLEPTVFARLRLEVISQLRSHGAVALYEICTRYKGVGQTPRQAWRWWVPVLTGNPMTDRQANLEYRIFKRDTLKSAVAEINAISDLDIELVEHKQGRAIGEIQFRTQAKRQSSLALSHRPPPVDLAVIQRAIKLGVNEEIAERMASEFGESALRSGLDSLEKRKAKSFPDQVKDAGRYLRAIMPGEAAQASKLEAERAAAEAARADPKSAWSRTEQEKLRTQWLSEWSRRRRAAIKTAIEAMSAEDQKQLEQGLQEHLQTQKGSDAAIARLAKHGWRHLMVESSMLRFHGLTMFGPDWDKPTAEELLQIAAELAAIDKPILEKPAQKP
jgi:hypothetical protein